MKILLIQPPKPDDAIGGEEFSIFEPLALEYLAAGVREDHDIRILDMRLGDGLAPELAGNRPDIVGITSFTVHVNTVKELFREIKAFDPAIRTIVGGHHATVKPEDFYVPEIEVIVAGEGVFIFCEIVERIEKGMPLSEIAGATSTGKGNLVISPDNKMFDLDLLPLPRRDLTERYRQSYSSEWMKPLASIRTSKGCPNRCSFCALWKLTGGRYFTRKPERIVEELKTIGEKYIFFCDDESLLDVKRMDALADMIDKAGIQKKYFLYGRTDTIARHPELILKWKKIGLERVFVGFEFYRDRDLEIVNKGTTAEVNAAALHVLKDLSVDIWPMFIVRPDFELQDFRDLRKHCCSLCLDFVAFSVLTPLPGTDLYEDVKDGLVDSNYDHFDFFHSLLPTRLPSREFYGELIDLYKNSRPFKNQVGLMRKYPLREWPALFKKHKLFIERLSALRGDPRPYR